MRLAGGAGIHPPSTARRIRPGPATPTSRRARRPRSPRAWRPSPACACSRPKPSGTRTGWPRAGRASAPSRWARASMCAPSGTDAPGPADRLDLVVNPGLAFGTGGPRDHAALHGAAGGAGRPRAAWTAPSWTSARARASSPWRPSCWAAGTSWPSTSTPTAGPAMDRAHGAERPPAEGRRGPTTASWAPWTTRRCRAPTTGLLANILLETIQELLPRMAEVAAPGGWLVASGILAERRTRPW